MALCANFLQTVRTSPPGHGDVRIWHRIAAATDPEVRMPLRGTGGSVLLNVPSEALREWLVRTCEAVHSGEEHARIDWDSILSALLSK
ncbi:SsgA family sporulation/cell division regulator [Streptomyces sp. NPDC057460]|uniref:SsgA family sporulation/cell division regulator n=1 Tax=Streptomyces sp. NPDC057460 TaxID=3346141 RepID=UPI003688DFD6